MTRVLSVVHGNTFGGPHNRNSRLAPLLEAEHDVRLTVLVPSEPGDAVHRLRQARVDVVETPVARVRATRNPLDHGRFLAGFTPAVRRMQRIIRERGVDIVQINGISNPHAAVAARRERIPVVWQILDTYPPMWFRRLMMPWVLRTAGAVMVTGQRVAEAHPGASDAADRLVSFYPPVDTEWFQPNAGRGARARARLGLADDDPVVGNVSNLNPQKGHETFVRAASMLRRECPDVKFVILGQRYDRHAAYIKRLLERAQSLGLQPDENLIVRDPGDDVADLEAAFDVFWMTPEPRSEGIPTVVEEAMALGLPAVVTDAGSMSEIVRDGETGYVVPPYDTEMIVRRTRALLESGELRQRMGERARRFAVGHFSVTSCAERHVHAYSMALGDNPSPGAPRSAIPGVR